MPIINTEVTETINITENGQYDVAKYTSANVSVSGGGSGENTLQFNVVDGVLEKSTTLIDLTGVTDIGTEVCMSMYQNSAISGAIDMSGLQQITGSSSCANMFDGSGITSIDLSGVTTIGEYSCGSMCSWCLALESFDLSSLEEVSEGGCSSMFVGDELLTSADLPALTTIQGNGCFDMFANCTGITSVDMSNVETIGSFGCSNMFANCTGITSITFDSLTTLESGAFSAAFGATSMTSLSFPALTTFSDGSEDAFSSMLQEVDGCTVHFPAALQSTMENWQDVLDGFGGTNTTVLFDL